MIVSKADLSCKNAKYNIFTAHDILLSCKWSGKCESNMASLHCCCWCLDLNTLEGAAGHISDSFVCLSFCESPYRFNESPDCQCNAMRETILKPHSSQYVIWISSFAAAVPQKTPLVTFHFINMFVLSATA